MKKNLGKVDRIIRLIFAIILAAVGYFYNIWWLYIVSVILLITATIGYCGLYSLLKVNTIKKK